MRRSLRTASRTPDDASGDADQVPKDALLALLSAAGATGAGSTAGAGTGAGVKAGAGCSGSAGAGPLSTPNADFSKKAADFSSGIVKGFGLIEAMVNAA
jgi:hypothetical protein